MAKTLALVITTLLSATVLIGLFNSNAISTDKKQLVKEEFQPEMPYIFATDCTESLVV
jgi:hypothetical protein